jgi:Mn2+/Fe2+ NRAMP family transporter
LLYPVVFLLLVANTINLAADLSAMGAAVKLLIGGPAHLYIILLAGISVVMQIRIPYTQYAKVLRWLCLALFAYVATIFTVQINWGEALHGTFLPTLGLDGKSLTMFIAVLGTTISPYLFFWQASGEVEEVNKDEEAKPLKRAPEQAPKESARIVWDTYVGMAFSNLVAFFIILTVAATLHQQGKTEIETAAQAAEALRPVAGPLAFFLFAIGIVGTGMLALPVLAGSAAYAVGEALKWPTGLERKAHEAKGFYAVIAVATLLGIILNFTPIDPIKALIWTAVINGVTAAPLMVVMMLMTTNRKVMGQFTLSKYLRITGWLATALMMAATIGLFATWGR